MQPLRSLAAVIAAAFLLASPPVRAADTIEAFGAGASDVEMYLGYDGIGLAKIQRVGYGDVMVGYGLRHGLSAYVGAMLEGHEGFSTGTTTNYVGLFGTPLDTDHFDADLLFEIGAGGIDRAFKLRPAIELNLDSEPDMSGVGAYVRAPLPIYGRRVSSPFHPSEEGTEITFQIESIVGVYASPAPGHQLLLQYNMGFHPNPNEGEDERATDIGGVSAGYNVLLFDDLELINQVFVDIPQDDEKASFGLMIGFIATLPHTGE